MNELGVVGAFALCRYTGEKLLDKREEPGLLEASWQPAPQGTYPDLPQSPRAQASSGGKASTSVAPPRKQGQPCPWLLASHASLMSLTPVTATGRTAEDAI